MEINALTKAKLLKGCNDDTGQNQMLNYRT